MGWLGLVLVYQDKAVEGEQVSRKALHFNAGCIQEMRTWASPIQPGYETSLQELKPKRPSRPWKKR